MAYRELHDADGYQRRRNVGNGKKRVENWPTINTVDRMDLVKDIIVSKTWGLKTT